MKNRRLGVHLNKMSRIYKKYALETEFTNNNICFHCIIRV